MESIFEPLGNEPLAGVYVYLPQPPCAGVHELVRHAGRHHHDLAATRLDYVFSGSERNAALLHHEALLVGMPVQLRAASGRRFHHDERDAGAVSVALELACVLATRRVGHIDDARHAPRLSGSLCLRRGRVEELADHRQQQIGAVQDRTAGGNEVRGAWDHRELGLRDAARSPITPPPSSRNISTACSRRMASESPTMSRAGAAIPRMSSGGQAKGSVSSCLSLATSVGKSSGFGAVWR